MHAPLKGGRRAQICKPKEMVGPLKNTFNVDSPMVYVKTIKVARKLI